MRVARLVTTSVLAAIAAFASLMAPVASEKATELVSLAEQEAAAEAVLDQLEQSADPISMESINQSTDLGPMPWLSFTAERSNTAVEAWVKVAEQLPETDFVSSASDPLTDSPLLFAESEAAGEVGSNDTVATGEAIAGFGTAENPVVQITGNLSGSDRVPIETDCQSVEDDGSFATATLSAATGDNVTPCAGLIGDGPFGETSGDVDFYSFGEVEVGATLILDVVNLSESFDQVTATIAIYNAAGEVLASDTDTGEGLGNTYLAVDVVEAGTYYALVAGCCGLPSDPTDSSSGPGVGEVGTYEVFVVAFAPPCSSTEDDGSIALANDLGLDGVGFVFCGGYLGDGPHGNADTDFYNIGEVEAGNTIFSTVFSYEEAEDASIAAIIGVYDDAGNLLTSATNETGISYQVETTSVLYLGVAGCCTLPSDPTDPASGTPSEESGPYELVVENQPLGCESEEDDGSIELANSAISEPVSGDPVVLVECAGVVGDGPHADSTGDVDFFQTREIPAGRLLIVDLISVDEDPAAADVVLGIYNAEGELLAEGHDDPTESGPQSDLFFHEIDETGTYYVAFSGGSPTDPTDPTSGTNTSLAASYTTALIIDADPSVITSSTAAWGTLGLALQAEQANADRRTAILADLAEAREELAAEEEPAVDVDFFLVDLKAGDAIAGGFDRSRVVGIIDPDGVERSISRANLSFAYPADSPLRHARRTGFDHVATKDGTYAVFLSEGPSQYEGELRVVRAGLGSTDSDGQQIIFLDFDGANVGSDVFGTDSDSELSPLSSFLPRWGFASAQENALVDSIIDATLENIDEDLRVRDGRNGDRDASGTPTEFDVEVLNSRDHGERWGDKNVTRVIIGGTMEELQIQTIGIAQTIDAGNTDLTETAVVLLDLLSDSPDNEVSLNAYEVAGDATRIDLVGHAVGHIAAHEIGHVIGNWHTETFNENVSLMDAGGEFNSIFGVGDDGVFGTADDIDADFAEDVFNTFEGFVGTEDTAGRSVFAMSTGTVAPPTSTLSDLDLELHGVATPGEPVEVFGTFSGGVAPYTVTVDWGNGSQCPTAGTCTIVVPDGPMTGMVDAHYIYDSAGAYEVTVIVTDSEGETTEASGNLLECTIVGTKRNDRLFGTDGDDVICGLGGDDQVNGRGGNDIIFGGSGRDALAGGEGNDRVYGGGGTDIISGLDGDDHLSGGDAIDVIRGGDGNDTLLGRLSHDRLDGGHGDDLIIGGRGQDAIVGGPGDDHIEGARDHDSISGGTGNDSLLGGSGRDLLSGGNGDDSLSGGAGADRLIGGAGDDYLDGGADNDRCIGGKGANTQMNCER